MLTRLHVDNDKALVNFDLELPRRSLFLCANGSGKTSVFEAVDLIRPMMTGRSLQVPTETLTRWQTLDVQTFQIDAGSGSMPIVTPWKCSTVGSRGIVLSSAGPCGADGE